MCVQHGCTPSDFWQMTPSEVYVYLDALQQQVRYGSLTQDDVNDLVEMREQPAPVINGEEAKWL